MLTNFAPNAGAAGAAGDAIKRMAPEFQAELAAAVPDLSGALAALAADAAALAEGELIPDAPRARVAAADGAEWLGFALLALDVMVDTAGRLWLLEVNRVRWCQLNHSVFWHLLIALCDAQCAGPCCGR